MKRVVLMIVPALICGMAFTNCSSDKAEPQNGEATGELYVMGTGSATVPADQTDLVFTGDDIESFNVNTGEIVFAKVRVDDIRHRIGLYSTLYFYLDGEPLFDPPLRIHSGFSSIADVLGLQIFESKIYFRDHTQNYDYMPATEREALENEQDGLVQKRKKEMEAFIAYLRDAGKIDDTEGAELPPATEEPPTLPVDTLMPDNPVEPELPPVTEEPPTLPVDSLMPDNNTDDTELPPGTEPPAFPVDSLNLKQD